MAYKGKFKPINPAKYKGKVHDIVYRSLWELSVMKELDMNPNVLEWSSEEIIIRYRDPVMKNKDGTPKIRRYFPDFKIKAIHNGAVVETLIEVKPYAQTLPPKKMKSSKGQMLRPMYTYLQNQAKWKAATEYCAQRKWEFKVLHEKNTPSFVAKKKS